MITEQDIARIAAELEQAQDAVDALKLKRWTSKEAGAQHAAAKGRIELATAELERLNAQREAEQQALADRPNVEKAAAKDITAAQKELEASRQTLATAASKAQQALVALVEAAEEHNALIGRHSAALTVRGLALDDDHDHQTGGTRGGLRTRGAWWMPVESGTLLAWVMYRVTRSRLPRSHGLTGHLEFFGQRRALDRRTDGLLDLVERLPETKVEPPVSQVQQPAGAIVHIESERHAIEEIESALKGWASADELGQLRSTDAPDSVKESVIARKARLKADLASGRIKVRYS